MSLDLDRWMSDDISSDLMLTHASFSKHKKTLTVYFKSKSILPLSEMKRIESEFSELLGEATVETDFSFPNLKEELKENFEHCAPMLLESMEAELPGLRPVFESSKLTYQNDSLILNIPASSAERAFSPQIGQKLNLALTSVYGTEIPLRVVPTEELTLRECSEKKPSGEVKAQKLKSSAPKAKSPSKKDSSSAVPTIPDSAVLYGSRIKRAECIKMKDVKDDSGRVTVCGSLFNHECRETKGGAGKNILTFTVTDYTNTIPVKLFLEKTQAEKFIARLEAAKASGDYLMVRGDYYLDNYTHEYVLNPLDINSFTPETRNDTSTVGKRVELHLHTQMSTMDGLTRISDAMQTAARWEHKALAVTDHGVVQAFPEATKASKKSGVKLLFGVEGYLIPDCEFLPLKQNYVGICLRTVNGGAGHSYITEIGAFREDNGESFHTLVDTGIPFSPAPGYTREDYSNAPVISEVLKELLPFLEGCIPVFHDSEQAAAFYDAIAQAGESTPIAYVNTGILSHHLFRDVKDQSVSGMLRFFEREKPKDASSPEEARGISRLIRCLTDEIQSRNRSMIPVFTHHPNEKKKGHGHGANHIIILAKTQAGLKNMYKLVSYSHLDYFKSVPRIPKSLLELYRDGLILGSACEAGELFRAMVAGSCEEELLKIASWYDYLEIQPIGNNEFMVREGTAKDDEELRDYNRRIVALGEKLNKPVAATGDVHFLEEKDATYRAILMNSKGFEDADKQAPLYFKTTDEMLEEFSYLGEEKAKEVVIDVPNAIADLCDTLKPYPDGTYAPTFDGAEDELKNMALTRAHEIYGDKLPPVVQARLDKELNSIITNGFSSLYLMAQRLVKKSLGDGYLVGSRGSVGSSLVATMAGITEVNALPPHYVCPNCKHSDFNVDHTKYSCGVDMPDAYCPVCGTKYKKDGYEIPFEVFLGFHGDKTPDIDLNFSGEYQPVAHAYCEVMFGEGHAFRAGTISAVQDKTVYGYVHKYCEEKGITLSRAETDRLVAGCSGVKRTTGQHPGGIVIVPKDREITDFTPVQHPADKQDADTITTHFDFHALDDRLVKLDILGHDDPTALKMLEDITGLNPRSIPLDDPDTMCIYSSLKSLGISLDALGCDVGSLGIPEFGTNFVRGMLMDTRPTTMEELVRIAGLSHGTDVWLNNAQLLVESGAATLSEVICTRDDIMNYLIAHGGEPSISFKTMESVRKGRGLTEEMEAAMRAINIPEWFVDSCKKIKYMFPRAHAVAYVMMSFRIAYYKVHYPLAFYAVYYTVRADAFDVAKASGGAEKVLQNIREIERKGKDASVLDKDLQIILEVVYEMNLRGIELLPVDLMHSKATRFTVEGNAIRPPFSSVAGVGANAAIAIAEECEKGPFNSVEDFQQRTRANSAVINALRAVGCFDGLPERNQVSFF